MKNRIGLDWVGGEETKVKRAESFFLFIHAGEATSTKTQQTNSQVAMLCHTRGNDKGKEGKAGSTN